VKVEDFSQQLAVKTLLLCLSLEEGNTFDMRDIGLYTNMQTSVLTVSLLLILDKALYIIIKSFKGRISHCIIFNALYMVSDDLLVFIGAGRITLDHVHGSCI
jgi:hypothetical protein